MNIPFVRRVLAAFLWLWAMTMGGEHWAWSESLSPLQLAQVLYEAPPPSQEVDLTRLSVYAGHFSASGLRENLGLVAAATAAAFAGAFAGTRLMHKVTLRAVKLTVAAMLMLIAVLLAAGVV